MAKDLWGRFVFVYHLAGLMFGLVALKMIYQLATGWDSSYHLGNIIWILPQTMFCIKECASKLSDYAVLPLNESLCFRAGSSASCAAPAKWIANMIVAARVGSSQKTAWVENFDPESGITYDYWSRPWRVHVIYNKFDKFASFKDMVVSDLRCLSWNTIKLLLFGKLQLFMIEFGFEEQIGNDGQKYESPMLRISSSSSTKNVQFLALLRSQYGVQGGAAPRTAQRTADSETQDQLQNIADKEADYFADKEDVYFGQGDLTRRIHAD